MKNKLQVITIVLLVVVIIFMGIMYSGQRRLENQLSYINMQLSGEIQGISSSLSSQVNNALMSDKFMAVDVRDEFPKSIPEGNTAEGSIYFELLDDIDIKDVYVIMDSANAEDDVHLKFEAKAMGNLKYKADAEIEHLSDYEYYVLGVHDSGDEVMLSSKNRLMITYRVSPEVFVIPKGSTLSTNHYEFEALLQVHEGCALIEKAELQIVSYKTEMDIEFHENGTVIDSYDITDDLVIVDMDGIEAQDYALELCSAADYDTYEIDVEGRIKDSDGFREDMYQEFIIVLYLSDGTEKVLPVW